MVNPQTSSKYPFQAFGNLSSKRYFRQQIQYLFPLSDHFINQMNIYFCLSTGSNTMQQTDILIPKPLCYLIICTLLVFIQRIERYHIVDLNIQTPDFIRVDLKDLLLHQSIQHSGRNTGTFQQFFLRHLSHRSIT